MAPAARSHLEMIRAAGFAGAVCRSSASRSTGRSRAFIILACLVAGAAGALRGESPVQDPVEVQVILTVTDRQDRYIDGLAAQNLVLKESGVPQAITSVTPIGSEPVAMSLLVDTSNSLEEHFTAVQAAAIEVARRLRPGDSAEMLRFASGVHRELSFTGDVTRIEAERLPGRYPRAWHLRVPSPSCFFSARTRPSGHRRPAAGGPWCSARAGRRGTGSLGRSRPGGSPGA